MINYNMLGIFKIYRNIDIKSSDVCTLRHWSIWWVNKIAHLKMYFRTIVDRKTLTTFGWFFLGFLK